MALQMGSPGVTIPIGGVKILLITGRGPLGNCRHFWNLPQIQESPSSSSERRWVPLPRADSERLEAILVHAAGKEPIV